MSDALLRRYTSLYDTALIPIATQLESLIRDHLKGVPRVDRVCARAKAPERFIAKARKKATGGSLKYSAPMTQIQDQVGARVIVFYKQDVEAVTEKVLRYFRHIELRTVVPDSEWMFGYFGKHLILALPAEAVPKAVSLDGVPAFFELQVKTLFQHAWSEAEHDLSYKPLEQLHGNQQRRLAYTAAQAWGADRTFEELFDELIAR